MRETGLEFPLVEADAGATGLPDASFDLVALGVRRVDLGRPVPLDPRGGAAAAPRRPARLPPQLDARDPLLADDEDAPSDDRLQRPQFGLHRIEWPTSGVEFHLGHGEWIDLLRANGFEIERLVELQRARRARASIASTTSSPLEWARRWPAEEIWVARKR